jgi:hypothetical protein
MFLYFAVRRQEADSACYVILQRFSLCGLATAVLVTLQWARCLDSIYKCIFREYSASRRLKTYEQIST